jgi:uncharacterized membrane protein
MTQIHDPMVERYLAAVARAASDLPAAERDALLADLSEHITSARADLTHETEDGVRAILDRLGDPASIVAEARGDVTPPRGAARSAPPAFYPMAAPESVPAGRSGLPTWGIVMLTVVGAVVLLCLAMLVVGGLAFSGGATPAPGIVTGTVPPSLRPGSS